MANDSVVMWSWIMMIFFIGLMLYLGYRGMKLTKNADDFATARSSYGPWVLGLAVVATTASGSTFMGIPGLAYSKGFASLWYPILYPIGIYGGMLLTAKLVKNMGDRFGNRTIPELVGERFQSDYLRIGMAIVSMLLLFYITAQLVAAAVMFETMMGLGYTSALWLTAIVLSIYLTMGGSHSDIMTDAVQGLFMLGIAVMVVIMFVLGVGVDGGMSAVNSAVEAKNPTGGWDTLFIVGDPTYGSAWLVFLLLIAHIPFGVLPHLGNKFMALKDPKQLRTFLMFITIAGCILPMMGLGGILGAAVIDSEIKPDQVIPALFVEVFPPYIAAFLAVGILSAILSTADGLIISFSQIFANDLYRRTFARNNRNKDKVERNTLIIGRVATVATILLSVLVAYNPPKFLAIFLWIGVGGIVAGLAGPLAIGSLWKRATKPGAIASFTFGVLAYACIYQGYLGIPAVKNPFAASGYSVILAVIVMVVVSLVTKPMSEEHLAKMFNASSNTSSDNKSLVL
jgi:SSS family transporter